MSCATRSADGVKRQRLLRKALAAHQLEKIYAALFKSFGPQRWWPGQTSFEIIVGAILTQNTNWKNVEQAIHNLKRAHLLTQHAFKHLTQSQLAARIRPSGYFNIKSRRLKNFIQFLFAEYNGSLRRMGRETLGVLREKLLRVNGIGPETADSILLYAFGKPIFVVDAYTRRLLSRHGFVTLGADYQAVQRIFHDRLKSDAKLFNEYHALIVRLGKDFCRPRPRCQMCPLFGVLGPPKLTS